jgi:Family of unknown function (DUF6510)
MTEYDYLDGNAAAGPLSEVFAGDITAAEGQCAHCGAVKHFAEARVYARAPGMVARCVVCGNVLMRMVTADDRTFIDMHGMVRLCFQKS